MTGSPLLLPGEHDVAVAVLRSLQQNLDAISLRDRHPTAGRLKLPDVDDTLGFVSDVDDDLFLEDLENLALDQASFLEGRGAGLPALEDLSEVVEGLEVVGLVRSGRRSGGLRRDVGRGGILFRRGSCVGFGGLLLRVHGSGVPISVLGRHPAGWANIPTAARPDAGPAEGLVSPSPTKRLC